MLALRQRWVGIPSSELRSFRVGEREILLKSIQGIFKPKELRFPLSIASTLSSPYNDQMLGERILYDFAPRSREHENEGLKECKSSPWPVWRRVA